MKHAGNRVVIVGGGIIGLCIARQLADHGWTVAVVEKGLAGQEATSAAAGMLAPRLEFSEGDELLSPALEALGIYREFVSEVEEESGLTVDLRLNGIVAPVEDVDRAAPVPSGAEQISGDDLNQLEPGLRSDSDRAYLFEGEGSVDNRALLRAVLVACRHRDVTLYEERLVLRVLCHESRVHGVSTDDGEIRADVVINCAGAWCSQIQVPDVHLEISPIKGQMLLLQCDPSRTTAPRHVIYSHNVYLVPRSDGRLIVGTTVEDVGFDKKVEAWAMERLLKSAMALYPCLKHAEVREHWAGLRPKGERVVPTVCQVGPAGYYAATGHYRNGILLAPLTGIAMRRLLA